MRCRRHKRRPWVVCARRRCYLRGWRRRWCRRRWQQRRRRGAHGGTHEWVLRRPLPPDHQVAAAAIRGEHSFPSRCRDAVPPRTRSVGACSVTRRTESTERAARSRTPLNPAGFEPRIPHVPNSGRACRVCLSFSVLSFPRKSRGACGRLLVKLKKISFYKYVLSLAVGGVGARRGDGEEEEEGGLCSSTR